MSKKLFKKLIKKASQPVPKEQGKQQWLPVISIADLASTGESGQVSLRVTESDDVEQFQGDLFS